MAEVKSTEKVLEVNMKDLQFVWDEEFISGAFENEEQRVVFIERIHIGYEFQHKILGLVKITEDSSPSFYVSNDSDADYIRLTSDGDAIEDVIEWELGEDADFYFDDNVEIVD